MPIDPDVQLLLEGINLLDKQNNVKHGMETGRTPILATSVQLRNSTARKTPNNTNSAPSSTSNRESTSFTGISARGYENESATPCGRNKNSSLFLEPEYPTIPVFEDDNGRLTGGCKSSF